MRALLAAILAASVIAAGSPALAASNDNSGVGYATTGGQFLTPLTAASPTGCTSIAVASNIRTPRLVSIGNSSGTAQTVVVTFFNEGVNPTCVLADQVYQITLGSSQVVTLNYTMALGIAYTLSAALTNPIAIGND